MIKLKYLITEASSFDNVAKGWVKYFLNDTEKIFSKKQLLDEKRNAESILFQMQICGTCLVFTSTGIKNSGIGWNR